MTLRVLEPVSGTLVEGVAKVKAEGPGGEFCLLPRHIDFVSTLVPGLLSYETREGREGFVAVDEGLLVKKGDEVLVSVRRALLGAELGGIGSALVARLEALEEEERKGREILARLEADFMRRFGDLR